jgi:hypothetical protein
MGSLHRFCEFHRRQANTNQKKWARRRFHGDTGDNEKQHRHNQPVGTFQDLLTSCSDASSGSESVVETARSEELPRDWLVSDPHHEQPSLFGSMDDIDLL